MSEKQVFARFTEQPGKGTTLACTLFLLGVLAFLPGVVFADARSGELEPADVVRAFPSVVKVRDPWRHDWITESRNKLWAIEPTGKLLSAPSVEELRKNGGESVPLPSSVNVLKSTTILSGAPDKDVVWLVDREARSVWRLESGKWLGPWLVGEEIGAACALNGRRLAINTPEHSESSFAILDRNGRVEQRFGERLAPSHPVLERSANSWLLVSLADGSIAAAHQYRPLIRLFEATGKRLWEKKPESPVLDELELHRAIGEESVMVDPRTCCYESKLTLFATDLTTVGDRNRFAVRYGLGTVVEEMNKSGEHTATFAFHPAESPWVTLGLSHWKGIWTAVETRRLTAYTLVVAGGTVGRVEAEAGGPIAGAEVVLKTSSGIVVRATTNDAGLFQLVGPGDASTGQVSARAPGFLATERTGVLAEISERPFVLRREPSVCIVVRDEAGSPVSDFTVELVRSFETARGASMEAGPRADFSATEGRGCLRAPWMAPFVVRVRAKGFATEEIRLEDLQAELAITLGPEARLELSVADESTPLKGVEVLLAMASTGDRTTTATQDDFVASSGDDGVVAFVGLTPGTRYRASAEQPDFLAASVEIDAQEGDNKAKLTLDRGAALVVRVTDARTQSPIQDAKVRVDPKGLRVTSKLECSTAADGTCSVKALPPGRVEVSARATERVPTFKAVSIPQGERTVQAEVSLSPGTELHGVIHGVDMYADTPLDVTASRPGSAVVTVPVAADGRFVIESIRAGAVSVWIDERTGGSNVHFEKIAVPEGVASYEVSIDLPRPIRISGRIERNDVGCGSCTLEATRVGAEVGRPQVNATVQPDGRFSVRLPTVGQYLVRVADSITGEMINEQITVTRDAEKNFTLGEGVIDVEVLRQGKPAAGATVQCHDSSGEMREATTDVAGKAVFRGLPRGRYSLTASLDQASASEIVELRSQARAQLRIADEPGASIRLVDLETGLPVRSSVRVRVVGPDGAAFMMPGLFPDADGMLEVPQAPTNAAYVVKAAGYAFKTMRPGAVSTGGPMELRLVPSGRSMEVRVTPAAGAPCSIEVRDASGLPIALSTSHNPGPVPFTVPQAMFNEIEPGSYTMVLRTCDGRVLTSTGLLAAGSIPVIVFGAP